MIGSTFWQWRSHVLDHIKSLMNSVRQHVLGGTPIIEIFLHSDSLTLEVENGPLEDDFPVQTGRFPLPC